MGRFAFAFFFSFFSSFVPCCCVHYSVLFNCLMGLEFVGSAIAHGENYSVIVPCYVLQMIDSMGGMYAIFHSWYLVQSQ